MTNIFIQTGSQSDRPGEEGGSFYNNGNVPQAPPVPCISFPDGGEFDFASAWEGGN
jgi:hypothetical protein